MSIAIVMAGTFQYRSHAGREVMTPGSLLLGSARQMFECGHERRAGDRCISFSYTPEFCDRLGVGSSFRAMRMPRIRPLSPIIAAATAAVVANAPSPWEQIAIELAVRNLRCQVYSRCLDQPAGLFQGTRANGLRPALPYREFLSCMAPRDRGLCAFRDAPPERQHGCTTKGAGLTVTAPAVNRPALAPHRAEQAMLSYSCFAQPNSA